MSLTFKEKSVNDNITVRLIDGFMSFLYVVVTSYSINRIINNEVINKDQFSLFYSFAHMVNIVIPIVLYIASVQSLTKHDKYKQPKDYLFNYTFMGIALFFLAFSINLPSLSPEWLFFVGTALILIIFRRHIKNKLFTRGLNFS